MTAPRTRVLYLVSRFPKVTETFVVNEWDALRAEFDMFLGALARSGEPPRHPAAVTAMAQAWFVRPLSRAAFGAHWYWLRRSPAAYGRVWRDVARDARRAGAGSLAKTIVIVHESMELAGRVREERIDHVHAHFANQPATAAWVVHRLTGVPFTFTAHANDLFRTPALLDRKTTEAIAVVAISRYNRTLLHERAPSADVRVIHCGVDTTRFNPAEHAPEMHPRHIVCVAGFEPKKGHRDLVAAFARLATSRADIDLVLAGDGPERAAITHLAHTLGLTARVTFLGACSTEDVHALLRTASVFVLPAVRDATGRMDGIPVALMEAMAAGVPVVTTSVSGIPELVDGAGMVVAPADPAAVAQAIAQILDDDASAADVVRRGRARVEQQFDLHAEARKLAELFRPRLD
jgi:glycosyltransferase involved in cell wall biosynthesis